MREVIGVSSWEGGIAQRERVALSGDYEPARSRFRVVRRTKALGG
ncbi:MAG: hypothetical protein ACJ79K_13510 [Gemmatimonadaceae bacterium]